MDRDHLESYSCCSPAPHSIRHELDNVMLATNALNAHSGSFHPDKEAGIARHFFLDAACDAMEARFGAAMDLARKGEVALTTADLAKVCEWAKAQGHEADEQTLARVMAVVELFVAQSQASSAAAQATAPNNNGKASRRKPPKAA